MEMKKINSGRLRAIGYDVRAWLLQKNGMGTEPHSFKFMGLRPHVAHSRLKLV
jgi:hypothetical protein